MVIVMGKWKKKVVKLIIVMVLIITFIASVPVLTGLFYKQVPAFSGWFQDEEPSGNPMRVENSENTSKIDQILDQFVINLQNFYYEE